MIAVQTETLVGLISGLGGALIGGAASFGGVWLTLSHQKELAREARLLGIGQVAADKALNELIALGTFLETVAGNDVVTAHTDERPPYLNTVFKHLRDVGLAVTRIPNLGVRERVTLILQLANRYRAAGVRHLFAVRWFEELRQDMVDALSAYIRDEALPPLSEETVEKQTRVARHEERQRRQFEHMHDPVNVDPGEEGDAFSAS
ncbi:hypothetical protein ACIP29_37725 [Streptomyces coelicoflavus]|uniref:hypothetical protein n=1 Tax=Streptomyces coelicoflavus TaxID=285562 RepID=UPI00381082C5